jgi:hypothetical protein
MCINSYISYPFLIVGLCRKQCAYSVFKYPPQRLELLSNLVFEDCWSCGDLVRVGGFNSVFESNAGDDLGEIIKAA